MKHIKKFETFDFTQTLPVTTKNFLTNFYSCDDCDEVWKEFNKVSNKCKFCQSEQIEDLSEDEFYEIQKTKIEDNQTSNIGSGRMEDSEELVDLVNMRSLSESNSYDYTILPQEALVELSDYVDYRNPENRIEVYPDPKVDGTFALRVFRKKDGVTFDLLWNRGAYDGVEFDSWPPVSGDLKFFF
jgi:hypothetical protein